ncbi:CBS domain-containing protein [Methanocella sp. CWC-04]|uniref:CBS domain-containing protein n=2 Tax=Methanooceanicella nereidis TaxID=2052831 RepID=A0AAP2W4L7_9EURY|nr:CBS domain-containing protein [Methanocella sp. CWC-04]
MIVEDMMSVNPVSINGNEFVTRARELMREYGYQSLPVVDDDKKIEGMITIQDVIKVTSTRSNVTVKGFIRRNVPTVTRSTGLAAAARTLLGTDEGRVPVVDDNGRLIGLLSIVDIFQGIGDLELQDEPVKNYMTKKVLVCEPEENVSRVWLNMIEREITGFPVVSKDMEVIGMVTREDIMKRGYARIERESERGHMTSTTVQKIMTTPPVTVNEDDSIKKVAKIFIERNIGRVPVVRDNKIVGIIDRFDIIRACRRPMLVD